MFAFLRSVKIFLIVMPELIIFLFPWFHRIDFFLFPGFHRIDFFYSQGFIDLRIEQTREVDANIFFSYYVLHLDIPMIS